MRPWDNGGSDARAGAVLAFAAFPLEGAEGWIGSDNFLRAGNTLSLAAENRLEIHAEACFHHFAATLGPIAVAENQIVPHWLVQRRRQIDIDRLVVRRLDRENSVAGTTSGRFILLLFVQDREIDIRGVVGFTVCLADK